MSDIFEFTSENKNDLRAFASFDKFTIVAKEGWIRAPEVSVDLTPSQARELARLLNEFADTEDSISRFAMGTPDVGRAGENKEVKPSTGQTWTHKQKGYDVKIDYINRTGDVVVEEVATGQRDGFGRKAFLERFSPKSKEGDA